MRDEIKAIMKRKREGSYSYHQALGSTGPQMVDELRLSQLENSELTLKE